MYWPLICLFALYCYSAALQTKGAAGLLGLDPHGWRHLCTTRSKVFGSKVW